MMKRIFMGLMLILLLSVTGFMLSNSRKLQTAKTNFKATSKTSNKKSIEPIKYNPPLPKDAPEDMKKEVMLGYNIMNQTQKYAGKYVGNKLTCSNCHFNGGISEGGKNGGLSLVGVATEYPKYRPRAKAVVDLLFRTNSCFVRSMNGKPLPLESKEMVALVTYFQWISKGLPIYQKIPWLGLKHIKNDHKPDAMKGKEIFAKTCIACHGADGQGTTVAPPLWGKNSFNDGAGMDHLANFAAFAHNNMPYHVSNLTEKQALDVAAYVTSQPRPHFSAK
jgi:thiosulfate dehydrogenase